MTTLKTTLNERPATDTPFAPTADIAASDVQAAIELAVSSAAADLAAHVAAADPHPQYMTAAETAAGYQPLDSTLTALAAFNTNGLLTQTAADTFTGRTLTGPAAGISVTNGNGVAGNPTLALANDLAAVEGLATNGLAARTATDTWATRTITGPAAGITVSNGDGVSGDPTLALANDLAALEALASTGFAARTTTDTWAQRTLTAPAAGLTITNPAGIAGNPTFALANDLAAVEGLGTTGLVRRTGTDTWSAGTTVSTAEIADDAVTNAKLANVATSTLKGRLTASTGDPEDLTIGGGFYSSGTTLSALGVKNLLINGSFRINRRAAASNADDTYAHDRWNILTQSNAVAATTVQLVEDGTVDMMRITQSNASAQRFGVEQILEAAQSHPLRGQAVTLSARVRMSATTTLRYAILEWTGTANAVTSDVVLSWTSTTFTAGNFFLGSGLTVTATGSTALTANTLTSISLSATLGSSFNNLIVFFWTDSTQAQNVTLDIGNAQFERGSVATLFERIPISDDELRCQRYYFKQTDVAFQAYTSAGAGTSGQTQGTVFFKSRMYNTPSITLSNISYNNTSSLVAGTITQDGVILTATIAGGAGGTYVKFDIVAEVEL